MSAFFRGGGVKNLPNWPTDSSKKLPTVRGKGQKCEKFADVLNGWSLNKIIKRFKIKLLGMLHPLFWYFGASGILRTIVV